MEQYGIVWNERKIRNAEEQYDTIRHHGKHNVLELWQGTQRTKEQGVPKKRYFSQDSIAGSVKPASGLPDFEYDLRTGAEGNFYSLKGLTINAHRGICPSIHFTPLVSPPWAQGGCQKKRKTSMNSNF